MRVSVSRGALYVVGATMPEPPPSRLVSVLLLGAIVLAGLLAVWLFPLFQAWVAHQDCVALGRTDCG